MTVQTINIGNVVNDGLGDDLRSAFQKVNANFSDLSTQLTITATNVGLTGVGVFKQKTGADLEFKNLVAGRNIAIDDNTNTLEVRSTAQMRLRDLTQTAVACWQVHLVRLLLPVHLL